MSLRLISDCASEIVSLSEIKLHLRLSTVGTAEDAYLNVLAKAARTQAENITKRAFIAQTWALNLDTLSGTIEIPRPPISSTSSDIVIKYRDEVSGNSTTLASTAYFIDYMSEPARITPSTNSSHSNDWPNVFCVNNAVTIQYVAGSTAAAPDDVKIWCLMRIADLYENRESVIAVQGMTIAKLPRTHVDGLLDRHCIIEVMP